MLPFLILEMILAFEAAVRAVSEPERNPEIIIKKIIINRRIKFINDIKLFS
tara:strand:+ start:219 stop:371 length:153 start_codon:yes stop_codon:yes gene_type:complete